MKDKDLCNGPSKLCDALQIKKNTINMVDLTTSDDIWLTDSNHIHSISVIACPRINIGYAGDWVEKPLRFYVKGNPCVSVRNKKAEEESIIDSEAISD